VLALLAAYFIHTAGLQGVCSFRKLDFKHQNLVVKVVARRIHVLILTEVDVSYSTLVWASVSEGRLLAVLSDEVVV
jgi:hypothetical protein